MFMRECTDKPCMRLLPIALSIWMAVSQGTAFAREEVKVSMEDVLKEITKMRRELRDLKIQRDRDQRVIEELRRIVENGIPADLPSMPQPAVAAPSGGKTGQPDARARPVPPPMSAAE